MAEMPTKITLSNEALARMRQMDNEARRAVFDDPIDYKTEYQNMPFPGSAPLTSAQLAQIAMELKNLTSSERAKVIRDLYRAYPTERDQLLSVIGDSLKPAPSDPGFRVERSTEALQLEIQNLERRRMEAARRAYEQKRSNQEPVPLPKTSATADEFNAAMRRAYAKTANKLYGPIKEQVKDYDDYPKWQVSVGEMTMMDAVVSSRKGMAFYSNLTEDRGYEPAPTRAVVREAKREVPVAPTGGRRKIRLED